jgi:LCP family protein required for cell wall assembly
VADGSHDEQGRRVLGRSRAAEPRSVVVDPSAVSAPPAPPVRPAASPPAPPVVPPAPRPWNESPPERQVLGSSNAAPRPVTGSGAGAPPPPGSRERTPGGPDGPGRTPLLRRIRLRHVVVAVVLLLVVVPTGLFAFGWWQYSRIPKVDVSAVLSSHAGRTGTNYLIVGTDSREGITAADPNAGAFLGETVTGARTDTIMVLHVEGSQVQLVSVPRDLWVTDPATGKKGRINSTFSAGPANLIKAVEQLGIPVDHYMEINFVSFSKLVDAVGGITIDFPNPAKDDHSGLYVDKAGKNHLDGSQALAYVRSRYYTELVNGKWVTDPTADIGRTERQRAFLTALMHGVTGERNPIALVRLPGALGSGLKIDTTLGYLDALRLGWKLKGAAMQPVALPVTPRTTSGGADVLDLQPSAAAVVGALAR